MQGPTPFTLNDPTSFGNQLPLFQKAGSGNAADSSIFIFPGFCDVHVHFREPGFSYKDRKSVV